MAFFAHISPALKKELNDAIPGRPIVLSEQQQEAILRIGNEGPMGIFFPDTFKGAPRSAKTIGNLIARGLLVEFTGNASSRLRVKLTDRGQRLYDLLKELQPQ